MTGVQFPPLAAEKWACGRTESTVHTGAVGAASSFAPHRLQHPFAGQMLQKYTLNISWLFNVLKSP
jgi:hypothetical protein